MLTEDQLKERNKYIGCSEFAAAIGLDPYKSAMRLWAEKTGQLPIEDVSEKLQVKLGHKLEPVVADLFLEWLGDPNEKVVEADQEISHPKYKFLVGHVDRWTFLRHEIVEIKTTSPWRLKEFEDDSWPAKWLVQVHGYLAISGAEKAYIAALFGNQEFKVKVVQKDPDLEADIIKKVVKFWEEYVLTKTMPAAIRYDDAPTLYELFPEPVATPVDLPDEANILADAIEGYKTDMDLLKKQSDEARNRIKAMLKEHALGNTDKFKFTWKEVKRNILDSEKIKAEDPSIYKKFGMVSTTRELRIRRIDESD